MYVAIMSNRFDAVVEITVSQLYRNDKVPCLSLHIKGRYVSGYSLFKLLWHAGSPGDVLQSFAAPPGHGPCQTECRQAWQREASAQCHTLPDEAA